MRKQLRDVLTPQPALLRQHDEDTRYKASMGQLGAALCVSLFALGWSVVQALA